MPYTNLLNLKRLLGLGAMAAVGLTPVLAHAQFKVNDLFGKTYPQVVKMLGNPIEKTESGPIIFSRFKTPGALDTIVWYFYNSHQVGKVQIQIVAKPGETADQILKRYGLSVGSNPHVFPGVKPPGHSMASEGQVPGMPWIKVFISYMYAMAFKPELMKYCKEHNLKPASTYFWTIQVNARKPRGDRMMGGAEDVGGGAKSGGKGAPKGKGKGK